MLRLIALSTPFALALGLLVAPAQEKKPAEKAPPPAAAKPAGEMPHGIRAWHVQLELGPKFDPKVPPTSQPGFEDHVKNMQGLASEGTLLLGGPMFEGADSEKIIGGVMIVKAKDEKALREKFANDPFFTGGVMKVGSVHPMMVGVGAWMPKEKEAAGH